MKRRHITSYIVMKDFFNCSGENGLKAEMVKICLIIFILINMLRLVQRKDLNVQTKDRGI